MATKTIGSQITKSEYEDGHRGYYGLIPICLFSTFDNAQIMIVLKMRAIAKEAIKDGYWINKYYNRWLNNGDIKVYGVGEKLHD